MLTHRKPTFPVIICGGTLTGAGVARILSHNGIKTYWAADDVGIFRYSRHFRPVPGMSEGLGASRLAATLQSAQVDKAVVMPCADDCLLALGKSLADGDNRFFASLPPLHAIETVVDKAKFALAVQRLSVTHPRTTIVNSINDIRAMSDADFRGFFLKPVDSLAFTRRHGVKALIVQDKAGALARAETIKFPILLQEYIPGPPTAHYFIDGFIDRHGRMCALFARRRLRMYPPKLSNSTLMVSIPVEDVQPAADSLRVLLKDLHYRGIFSAEFKYDERDEQFKILEVNARPWWYVEFAAHCGVDVCTMAYRDALDMDVKPVTGYRVGVRHTYLPLDLAGFVRHADGFPTSFWAWFKSVAGAYDAIFRWSDPGPALAYNFGFIRRHWRFK